MSGYDLPIENDNEREWYANVGRIQERERIIKLLEKNLESWEECIVFRKTYDTANVPSLIALIKGEK